MVWDCFSGHGIVPIHKVNGIMGRFMYCNILKDVMLPYASEEMPLIGRFQQDNDPKRTSKVCKTWLQSNKFQVLHWPISRSQSFCELMGDCQYENKS